ncbi:MAG: C40 family peptidase [Gemmatimonadota bacterium]|nr:C40 family peptidase [Gemmatimonadota bacterium]
MTFARHSTVAISLILIASSSHSALAQSGSARASARHGATPVVVHATVYGGDVVRTAKKYIGVPYELGGDTPRAFDCSGFLRYVFAQHGIEMPRTAHEQSTVGDAPHPGDLQPGDLLFFWGGLGAQHIAMYVGGDTIIHASIRGKRVRLDRFSGSAMKPTWFGERLIAVRRVLPAEGVLTVPMTGLGGAQIAHDVRSP